MNKLTIERRCQVVSALIEGCSVRSTVRMTGVAKNTVINLMCDVGDAAADYQDKAMRNLSCEMIQVDEIWSFCEVKERNVPAERAGERGIGDVWTWVGIDPKTKLVPSYFIGERDYRSALTFMQDLKSRLANRVQLTTDGLKIYLRVVNETFGTDVDYAMLTKIYGVDPLDDRRYSPSICLDCIKEAKVGNPDLMKASTSHVERQNLTMRMRMRRFTRLTNGFSKKVENHERAVSLHFLHYNFACPHQTLTERAGGRKTTPAMAAGLADRVWSIEEIVKLAD